MSRCWSCCQENCGYRKQCLCDCHREQVPEEEKPMPIKKSTKPQNTMGLPTAKELAQSTIAVTDNRLRAAMRTLGPALRKAARENNTTLTFRAQWTPLVAAAVVRHLVRLGYEASYDNGALHVSWSGVTSE